MMSASFSHGHKMRLRRMLVFIALRDPQNAFLDAASEMDWGPRTCLSYWETTLSLKSLLRVEITTKDELLQRTLKREEAKAEVWDIEDPSQILSQADVDTLFTAATNCQVSHVLAPAIVAIWWGQRIGDVLQLEWENIFFLDQRVSVRFTVAKTIQASKDVYCLHTSPESAIGKIFRQRSTHTGTMFQVTHAQISAALRLILGHPVDLRALRRTGLTRMGMANLPLATIQLYSRHKTPNMLELYLGSGLFNGAAAVTMLEAERTVAMARLPW